jgi:hypothetical protein
LRRAELVEQADRMPGQASQSPNDDDWSMAIATSSVQTPVSR